MDEKPRESSGQQIVRWLRPAGCALVLVVAVIFIVTCFTSGRNPIPGYVPPQSSEYYASHLDELQTELEAHVFPVIGGIDGSSVEDGKLRVDIEEKSYAVTRAAILKYYDQSLFEFVEQGK